MFRSRSNTLNRLRLRRNPQPRNRATEIAEEARRADVDMLRGLLASMGGDWYMKAAQSDAAQHLDEFGRYSVGKMVAEIQDLPNKRWSSSRIAALLQVAREVAYRDRL